MIQSLLLAASMVSAYPSSVKPGVSTAAHLIPFFFSPADSQAPGVSFMFPDGREPVEGSYHKQPCGTSPVGTITDYPLTGGKISMGQSSATDNVNFLWSKFVDGDDYEFKTYGAPTVVDLSSGHFCSQGPDFSSLGFKAGDKATLMVMYQADGPPSKSFNKRWNFQCADVQLVDNWVEPSSFMCANYGNGTRVGTAEQTMDVTVSPESMPNAGQGGGSASSAQVDMAPVKAGGIGAGVTVGVFLLALGALWACGLLRLGKKQNIQIHDDRSSVSSMPVKQVRST